MFLPIFLFHSIFALSYSNSIKHFLFTENIKNESVFGNSLLCLID